MILPVLAHSRASGLTRCLTDCTRVLYSLVMPATNTTLLVEAVKAYALAHYEDGGWDVVVETYTDAEIADRIGAARTVKSALHAFAPLVDAWSDRQADVRNSVF